MGVDWVFLSSLVIQERGHHESFTHFFTFSQHVHKHIEAMSNRADTVIEDAPVELWREIFEYFDLFGLWLSFRGLNTRIDAIIDQTPLDLQLSRRGMYARFVKNVQPTMEASTEINHFFSLYRLQSLVQLCSLCLKLISFEYSLHMIIFHGDINVERATISLQQRDNENERHNTSNTLTHTPQRPPCDSA